MSAQLDKTLLIVDDDRFFCKTLTGYLKEQNFTVISAHTASEGLKLCQEHNIDVVLLDQKLPDGNGNDLCKSILQINDQIKIIFITAFPSFDNAVKALRNGACDYLSKPLEIEEVAITVRQAFRTSELEKVERIHTYKSRQELEKNVLIGKDCGLRETYRYISLAATNNAPVLITGETGTGKNVVAKSIHNLSGVGSGCFMDINCAALPENLIEAELFGYEKGAFTGAAATKKGIFELADGGTLFLDEIGELPLNLQSKLLSVLDEQKIKRLGGQSFKHISVRIMAATNVNLEEAVIHKKFRQDLFYRLSVLPIHIPPLRERREDIIPLCRYFIAKLAQSHEITLPSSEIEALVNYQWPGNVRELKNIIERALIFQQDNEIYPSDLLSRDFRTSHAQQKTSGESITPLADVEKNHIIQVLSQVNHNHTHAARGLGISRSTLLRKMKIYSIPPTVS